MLFLILTTLIKFVVIVFLFAMPLATLLTWMERRQSAYTQDRVGPNRAAITLGKKRFTLAGLLHPIADALKMFFKESFVPECADKFIFRIAPLFGFVTALIVLGLIPFGPDLETPWGVVPLQIARLDAGLLYVFAVGSLGIYGAALAGWASKNKFALLGGVRATAQSFSYEIALGLTIVGILMAFGTTELSQIVTAQEGMLLWGLLPKWGLFIQPLAAVLFLTAAMAETKRAPFDMPEGESEIIGYFVEYSSMGFGLFMLGEFVEVVVLSALFTTLFLGGWQFPYILGEHSINLGFRVFEINTWVHAIIGMAIFGAKVFFLSALQLQLRWSLPRFRYDQLMNLGWKILLPLSLVNIFVTAILMMMDPSLELMALFSAILVLLFILFVITGPRQSKTVVVATHH